MSSPLFIFGLVTPIVYSVEVPPKLFVNSKRPSVVTPPVGFPSTNFSGFLSFLACFFTRPSTKSVHCCLLGTWFASKWSN